MATVSKWPLARPVSKLGLVAPVRPGRTLPLLFGGTLVNVAAAAAAATQMGDRASLAEPPSFPNEARASCVRKFNMQRKMIDWP